MYILCFISKLFLYYIDKLKKERIMEVDIIFK